VDFLINKYTEKKMPKIPEQPTNSVHDLDVDFYKMMGQSLKLELLEPKSAAIIQTRAMEELQLLSQELDEPEFVCAAIDYARERMAA
jgi:hypothetical protein